MRRFLLGVLFCLALYATTARADTPGEEAVKEAIKTLKEKRATVKDKADQLLIETAIRDLEERLAQVGKGEPAPEAKKDGDAALPKNWELKFNTGKAKPTFDPKTGVLKLAYDFSDAKQLKDFTFADDVKPAVQKGMLTVKGGDEIQHVVKFKTISVGVVVVLGGEEIPLKTSGDYWVFAAGKDQTVIDVCYGKSGDTFIAGKGLGRKVHGNNTSLTITEWFVSETKVGLKAGNIDVSGKKKSDATPGQLILAAKSAPNQFSKLTVSGTVDPEWAKAFFADK
jgi:hypothetical protein